MVTDNFAADAGRQKADKAIKDGDELGLLHGLPVGVKDLEVTKGLAPLLARCFLRKTYRIATSPRLRPCTVKAAS